MGAQASDNQSGQTAGGSLDSILARLAELEKEAARAVEEAGGRPASPEDTDAPVADGSPVMEPVVEPVAEPVVETGPEEFLEAEAEETMSPGSEAFSSEDEFSEDPDVFDELFAEPDASSEADFDAPVSDTALEDLNAQESEYQPEPERGQDQVEQEEVSESSTDSEAFAEVVDAQPSDKLTVDDEAEAPGAPSENLEPVSGMEAEVEPEAETEPEPESEPEVEQPVVDEFDGMPQPRGVDDLIRAASQSEEHSSLDPNTNSGLSDVFDPGAEKGLATRSSSPLPMLLIDAGIEREKVAQAEKVAAQTPGRNVADLLVDQGEDEEPVLRALALHSGLPFERVDLDKGLDGGFDGKLLQRLTPGYCKEHMVLPLRMEGSRPVIGATKPDAAFLSDELRSRLGTMAPKLVLVTGYDIRGALEIIGDGEEGQQTSDDLSEILEDVDESDVSLEKSESQEVDLEQQAGESPVIRYVNYIIQQAVKDGASDIHIEPGDKRLKVRFRIDGILFESMNPPASMGAAITSRIKIMANLDISERRLPQDGRVRCQVQGRKLDLRVSTLPNTYGEKTVMRILDTRSINVKLEDLGFSENTLDIWRKEVSAPHGIVLVTGPTGSGKTTTLYSSLRTLDKNKLNISTVEDPVEYHLDGVTQTQTHEKIGMNFAKALKALLRQDPDVIMVGEIRDMETAHTAVQAALTGHLVLSTLHTNDAPSSLTRLVNIGLEPFLVGAAVNGVLAQRLVRRLCPKCKELQEPTDELVEFLAFNGLGDGRVWGPVGCDKCRQTGYSGRVGIYELLAVDDQLRDVIARNPNVSEFRRMCLERGMVSLRTDGLDKVKEGMTSVSEVLRVTEAGH